MKAVISKAVPASASAWCPPSHDHTAPLKAVAPMKAISTVGRCSIPSRDASLGWTFGRRAVARSAVLRMSAALARSNDEPSEV